MASTWATASRAMRGGRTPFTPCSATNLPFHTIFRTIFAAGECPIITFCIVHLIHLNFYWLCALCRLELFAHNRWEGLVICLSRQTHHLCAYHLIQGFDMVMCRCFKNSCNTCYKHDVFHGSKGHKCSTAMRCFLQMNWDSMYTGDIFSSGGLHTRMWYFRLILRWWSRWFREWMHFPDRVFHKLMESGQFLPRHCARFSLQDERMQCSLERALSHALLEPPQAFSNDGRTQASYRRREGWGGG